MGALTLPKTMYDSVNLAMIPPDAQAVAGYVGGSWPTYGKLAASFPLAHRLSIAVNAAETAECLDVEQGDAQPSDAPAWVERMEKAGIWKPCLYANLSTMPLVLSALHQAGINRERVRLWVAHYTGTPTLPAGFDACQWTNHAQGRDLDESLVADDFFPVLVHSPHFGHQEQLAAAKNAQLPIAPAKKPRRQLTIKAPQAPHRKVVGATSGGGIGVATAGALQAFGVVHLTPAEAAALSAVAASLVGYLTPSRKA